MPMPRPRPAPGRKAAAKRFFEARELGVSPARAFASGELNQPGFKSNKGLIYRAASKLKINRFLKRLGIKARIARDTVEQVPVLGGIARFFAGRTRFQMWAKGQGEKKGPLHFATRILYYAAKFGLIAATGLMPIYGIYMGAKIAGGAVKGIYEASKFKNYYGFSSSDLFFLRDLRGVISDMTAERDALASNPDAHADRITALQEKIDGYQKSYNDIAAQASANRLNLYSKAVVYPLLYGGLMSSASAILTNSAVFANAPSYIKMVSAGAARSVAYTLPTAAIAVKEELARAKAAGEKPRLGAAIGGAFYNGISAAIGAGIGGGIGQALRDPDSVATAVNDFKKDVNQLGDKVQTFFSNGVNTVKEGVTNTIDNVKEGFNDFAANPMGKIREWSDNLPFGKRDVYTEVRTGGAASTPHVGIFSAEANAERFGAEPFFGVPGAERVTLVEGVSNPGVLPRPQAAGVVFGQPYVSFPNGSYASYSNIGGHESGVIGITHPSGFQAFVESTELPSETILNSGVRTETRQENFTLGPKKEMIADGDPTVTETEIITGIYHDRATRNSFGVTGDGYTVIRSTDTSNPNNSFEVVDVNYGNFINSIFSKGR